MAININSKLPPIPFFTLERAAKILDCEIDDFLFWNSEGMIPLFVYIKIQSDCELTLTSINSDYNQYDNFLKKLDDKEKFISNLFHPLSIFQLPTNFHRRYKHHYVEDPRDSVTKSKRKTINLYFNGYAKGIWRVHRTKHWLQPNSLNGYDYEMFMEGKIKIDRLKPVGIHNEVADIFNFYLSLRKDKFDFKNENIFEKKELLIDKKSIELLLSANGNFLPDIYMNERRSSSVYWNNDNNKTNKMVIKKTGKPQHFYKTFSIDCALLTRDRFAHCKIANISRKLYRKISDDFNAENAPTEQTIANWLYEIKLGKPTVKSSDDFELVIPDEWRDYSE